MALIVRGRFCVLTTDAQMARRQKSSCARHLCAWNFADDQQRASWLEWIGADSSSLAFETMIDATLDALADHLEAHVDCDGLLKLAR